MVHTNQEIQQRRSTLARGLSDQCPRIDERDACGDLTGKFQISHTSKLKVLLAKHSSIIDCRTTQRACCRMISSSVGCFHSLVAHHLGLLGLLEENAGTPQAAWPRTELMSDLHSALKVGFRLGNITLASLIEGELWKL